MITVGRSRGTPDGVGGWLLLPGCPVSGLASANTTTLGEEFLDSEDKDWDLLRSMLCIWRGNEEGDWHVRLSLASFYPSPFYPCGSWFVRICLMEFPECFFGRSFQKGVGFPGIVCFQVPFPFDEVFGTSSLSL